MKLTELLKDERMQNGLAVFGSLYAKRMLEGRYDQVMNTAAGQKLKSLDRPTKLGIEAALNFLAAYASTKETTLINQPWKKFVFEVVRDAPAELNKRLLNGKEHAPAPVATEEQIALESLGRLDSDSQQKLMDWLRSAGDKERQQMAEHLSNEVSAQAAPPPARVKSPSLLSDFAGGLSRLNESLERRRGQEAGTE
jgi:hypothetical protein